MAKGCKLGNHTWRPYLLWWRCTKCGMTAAEKPRK